MRSACGMGQDGSTPILYDKGMNLHNFFKAILTFLGPQNEYII
jgi:hypothetical protein